MLRPLLIYGTRPEAIKMAPIVSECRKRTADIHPTICVTGQHRQMIDSIASYFDLVPDFDLDLMQPNQSLAQLTATCIQKIDEVVLAVRPDCLVAQGDTTSVMASSLVAFYHRLPFVHVEAGLRTDNLYAPWPEELNRRVADLTAALYCAPTQRAADRLLQEGVAPNAIRVTGNTVIDALLSTVARERDNHQRWAAKHPQLVEKAIVLITGHRRESFGDGFRNICKALKILAERFPNVYFVYPVHLNPNVRDPVHQSLSGIPNLQLLPPLDYPEFVWLMDRATVILTDSGGIQEEAPSLGKPVLVMRDTTERPEAIEAGVARLVGTSVESICENTGRLLTDPKHYAACQIDTSPFGDGLAAKRIVAWMLERPWLVDGQSV